MGYVPGSTVGPGVISTSAFSEPGIPDIEVAKLEGALVIEIVGGCVKPV
jgi:hypothetical protein